MPPLAVRDDDVPARHVGLWGKTPFGEGDLLVQGEVGELAAGQDRTIHFEKLWAAATARGELNSVPRELVQEPADLKPVPFEYPAAEYIRDRWELVKSPEQDKVDFAVRDYIE